MKRLASQGDTQPKFGYKFFDLRDYEINKEKYNQ